MLHRLRRIAFGRDPLLAALADTDARRVRYVLMRRTVIVVGSPRYYGDTADCIASGDLAAEIAADAQAMDDDGPVKPYSVTLDGLLCVIAFTGNRYLKQYHRKLTSEADQIVAIPTYEVSGSAILGLVEAGSNIAFNPYSSDFVILSQERFTNTNSG